MPQVNDKSAELARQIVRYETQEKGFGGKLFGFEARDGFWSKLMKVSSVSIGAAGTAISTAGILMLATAVPIAGVALAAAAAGLASGAINRAMMGTLLSDMHDSKETNAGKFGHYALSSVPIIIGSTILQTAALFMAPVTAMTAGLAFSMTAGPLLVVAGSKISANLIGNQELRQEAQEARAIAATAISHQLSVDQLISPQQPEQETAQGAGQTPAPGKAPLRTPQFQHSITPNDYAMLKARLDARHQSHQEAAEHSKTAAADTGLSA